MTAQQVQTMESGSRLGHYEILDLLGKGGMGEVWRARDAKLGREVAIKTLPEEFSRDPDRLARFEREAKLLASLNHPNIAAIYGFEEDSGTRFLVLELVEGPTLEDRLKGGAISVEESLELALQISEALETAHEKGVIHRDLKPANIKVTPGGKVKVLDFGLAKAFAVDEADVSVSNSPTLSLAATQQGIILGTAAYMSPEQARGAQADYKSDVWSFGVLLFEMLSGQRAFDAPSVSDVLAAVLAKDPAWDRLPADLHPRIPLLLERCLSKEVRDRYAGIADARVDIQAVLVDPSGGRQSVPANGPATQSRMPWVLALVGMLAVGALVWNLRPTPEAGPIGRFTHVLKDDQQFTRTNIPFLDVSRDGSKVVYVANQALYLRAMDALDATLIPGTDEDPGAPFFSPDGQWIGFLSGVDSQLKKIAVSGGAPVTLTDVAGSTGTPYWRTNGDIVWSDATGLRRVPENGGTSDLLIERPTDAVLGDPQILPGGDVALLALGNAVEAEVLVLSLESGEQEVLFSGVHPSYVPTGHITYWVDGVLFAVPFDLAALEVVGRPVPLVEDVRGAPPQYAVSDEGTLVYVPGAGSFRDDRNLVFLDRFGNAEVLAAPQRGYFYPRFSPDETRIAVEVADDLGSNIWIYEIETEVLSQLTFEGGERPLWSPDGTEITYRNGGVLWTVPSDFSGAPIRLTESVATNRGPGSWSPDGSILLFASIEGIHSWEKGSSEPPVLIISAEGATVRAPEFSIDGRSFIYASDETGDWELYVSPFPVTGSGRQRITTDGGMAPVWLRDRQELIYLGPNRGLQSLEIAIQPRLVRSNPTRLFDEAAVGVDFDFESGRNFDVSADGERFIVSPFFGGNPTEAIATPRINIVQNWFRELRERVPVD